VIKKKLPTAFTIGNFITSLKMDLYFKVAAKAKPNLALDD
jgi:hypothetical protein